MWQNNIIFITATTDTPSTKIVTVLEIFIFFFTELY